LKFRRTPQKSAPNLKSKTVTDGTRITVLHQKKRLHDKITNEFVSFSLIIRQELCDFFITEIQEEDRIVILDLSICIILILKNLVL
jgi:hypothetical protein